MTHPSIQGLREALFKAMVCDCPAPYTECPHDDPRPIIADLMEAQVAYLTEHGVLLSGGGLVTETFVITDGDHVSMPIGPFPTEDAAHAYYRTNQPRGLTYLRPPIIERLLRPAPVAPVPQDGEMVGSFTCGACQREFPSVERTEDAMEQHPVVCIRCGNDRFRKRHAVRQDRES